MACARTDNNIEQGASHKGKSLSFSLYNFLSFLSFSTRDRRRTLFTIVVQALPQTKRWPIHKQLIYIALIQYIFFSFFLSLSLSVFLSLNILILSTFPLFFYAFLFSFFSLFPIHFSYPQLYSLALLSVFANSLTKSQFVFVFSVRFTGHK